MLRNLFAAVAISSLTVSSAFAGGMAEPVMEAEVIAEEASGTAGGWVVPLLLIAIVAAVAAGSGGSDPVSEVVEELG